MIIINSEQALAQQPAGSGGMPGSPTVRFEKQDPRQPCMGWKGGENETGQANVTEERWPALGGGEKAQAGK